MQITDTILGSHILPAGQRWTSAASSVQKLLAKISLWTQKIDKKRLYLPMRGCDDCTYPADQDGVPAIYFDHKMADLASLGKNLMAARGGWEGITSRDKPIPFIYGCEEIHTCAVKMDTYIR